MNRDDVTRLACRFIKDKKKYNSEEDLMALSIYYSNVIPIEWFHDFQEDVIDLQSRTRKDLQ